MNRDPGASVLRLRRAVWSAAAVLSAGGLLFGPEAFLGALSGGLLAGLNFELLVRFVGHLGGESPSRFASLGVFGLLFRYILLCFALFVIISVWHANVVALAVGFSAPVAAIFVECGLHAYRESNAPSETRDNEARK